MSQRRAHNAWKEREAWQQQQSQRRNLFSCPITLDHDNFIGDNNAVCAKLLPRSLVPLSSEYYVVVLHGKEKKGGAALILQALLHWFQQEL